MKKILISLLSLLIALSLLTGCSDRLSYVRENLGYGEQTLETTAPWQVSTREEETTVPDSEEALTFSQMEYVRPDMKELEATLASAMAAAKGEDLDRTLDGIYEYYDAYDLFYTAYCIADIRYSLDMTDSYWEEEYNWCIAQSTVVDKGLEDLYYALADSPCRQELEGEDYFGEGFFDAYDGENKWDDTYQAMTDREAALINDYYTLTAQAGDVGLGSSRFYRDYAPELAQVLADLVLVRQEMATYWGYDSYADFVWDSSFYRDYTPQQMRRYLEDIRDILVPIYEQIPVTRVWDGANDFADEFRTFSYVRDAAQAMGGTVWEAFRTMESRELFDISYGPNKYPNAFEVYLSAYQVPYVFVCPRETAYDKLTFAHEFGHFCNDFASSGSSAGTDVLEVLSQGMEYLSLCYTDGNEALARAKMADSLGTYVEQAAFAEFEFQIYSLEAEEVTAEKLEKIYDQVARDYGFGTYGYTPLEFTTITHFYISSFYVPSYMVSNDAAMELYSLEQETPGAGLAIYQEALDTYQSYFLAFLEEAGLASPFEEGRLEQVAELFRQVLLG